MKMNKKSGFTLVEIMIVVAIIGLLAAIAIPSFIKARTESQAKGCINNLRIMDAAKEQCAMEKGWATGQTVGATETNEMFPSTARRAANHAAVSAAVAA